MKFLDVPELAALTNSICGRVVGDIVLDGRVEAYSCECFGGHKGTRDAGPPPPPLRGQSTRRPHPAHPSPHPPTPTPTPYLTLALATAGKPTDAGKKLERQLGQQYGVSAAAAPAAAAGGEGGGAGQTGGGPAAGTTDRKSVV